MKNKETPKKLTLKETAKVIAKAAKIATKSTRKIVEFKKKRVDPSEKTGEFLNQENPYVKAGVETLSALKNKKIIKEFFPEITTSPGSVSAMIDESYEDLESSMIKEFEDKGLNIKKLEDFTEKNLRDSHILGAEIHNKFPNHLSSIQTAIDTEMRKTKAFILSRKEFWNK